MATQDTTHTVPCISTYQHTVVYRFLKKFRCIDADGLLNLMYLEPIMLLMWVSVFVVAIIEGIAWPRSGLQVPMIYDIPMFCGLFAALPLYLFCMLFFDLALNTFIRWVAHERRIDIDPAELRIIIDKLQGYYRGRWPSILSVVFSIVTVGVWGTVEFTNGKWTWLSHVTENVQEVPSVAGIMAILYIGLCDFILYSCVFRFFGWIWLLFRLSKFSLRIDPIHPDCCGGFEPISVAQKVIGYMLCGVGIHIVSIILNNMLFLNARLTQYDHMSMIIAFVVLAPTLFIFPLCFFRRKLWLAKQDATVWADTLINKTLDALRKNNDHADNDNIDSTLKSAMAANFIGMYRERVIAMREIPFDFKTLKSFLALAYAPLLSLVIPFLPATLQNIAGYFTKM